MQEGIVGHAPELQRIELSARAKNVLIAPQRIPLGEVGYRLPKADGVGSVLRERIGKAHLQRLPPQHRLHGVP